MTSGRLSADPEREQTRRIEYLPLDEIVGATRNPKRHDLAGVRASIMRFGFTVPALWDERTGRLVVGHGRLEALREMHAEGGSPPTGVTVSDDGRWLAPVVCGWASTSDAEAQAYLIADNEWTMRGGWDTAELLDLLSDVARADVSLLETVGYDEALLADLARTVDGLGGGRDPYAEWEGMPEYEQHDRQSAFQVIVHFVTTEDADGFFAAIERPRASSMWWPKYDGLPSSDNAHVVVSET